MRVTGNEASSPKTVGHTSHTQEAKKVEKTSTSDVEKTSSGNNAVNADISPKSKEMSKIKAAATDAPEIREDKVADLKRRIEDGSYHVNADALSDRMVDEHLGFPVSH